jgi:hypothetical protein
MIGMRFQGKNKWYPKALEVRQNTTAESIPQMVRRIYVVAYKHMGGLYPGYPVDQG